MPLISLLRHNHHDPHTKKVSKKAEASDGEAPKVQKKSAENGEVSNVEKGMIIAFFVIFGVISTASSLVGRSWSTVKNFLRRYYKRGTLLQTSRPEILTKRDKRILGSVLKNREHIREQVRRI